ncbi:MAG: DsrE family protein [Azospirillaceae bacterium]|nr:DsrE family protein [Azospirillaceae bacterium]
MSGAEPGSPPPRGTSDPATGKSAPGLAIVLFAGGFDRVHYGLALAASAAALSRPVHLLFSGRAVLALTAASPARPGWHQLDAADDGVPAAQRDQVLVARGVAGFEELLEACAALEVQVLVCEMALRALGLANDALRPDFPHQIGGIISFLSRTQSAQTLFI